MLNIVLLAVGFAALLVSVIPSLFGNQAIYLSNPDQIHLILFALFNLLFATTFSSHTYLSTGKKLTAVLLIIATVIQAAILLLPFPMLTASLPAVCLPLFLVLVAVIVSLATTGKAAHRSKPRQSRRQAGSVNGTPATPGKGRESGTVKWFNTSKGFGFISRDSGEDIFVHFRAIRGEGHRILIEGQRVEFQAIQRDKGLQAEDVAICD